MTKQDQVPPLMSVSQLREQLRQLRHQCSVEQEYVNATRFWSRHFANAMKSDALKAAPPAFQKLGAFHGLASVPRLMRMWRTSLAHLWRRVCRVRI